MSPPASSEIDPVKSDGRIGSEAGAREDTAEPLPTASDKTKSSSARTSLPEVVQMVTAFAAPTTLVAALLLFFGYNRTVHLFLTFGVDVGSLSYSAQDYMLRSVEAIYAPIAILLIVGVVLLFGHGWVLHRVSGRVYTRRLRYIAATLLVVGGAVLFRGLLGIAIVDLSRNELVLTPLALSTGAACTAYGYWLHRVIAPAHPFEWPAWMRNMFVGIVIAVVLLGLFWATTNVAQAYGRAVAHDFLRDIPKRPAITIYTSNRLYLQGRGVTEEALRGDQGFKYRYQGLRLLVQSDGRYFVFSDRATARDVTTFVVPVSDDIRIDLEPD